MVRLDKTLLKDVVVALSDLFVMANFHISGKGLKLQATDPRRVAFVVLDLPNNSFTDVVQKKNNSFTEYQCDEDLSVGPQCDEDLYVGLELAKMAMAFGCANHDDIVTISSVEDELDTVTLAFESPNLDRVLYVELDSVCVDCRPPFGIKEYPDSVYEAIVRIPSAIFIHICDKLSIFSEGMDSDPVFSISVDKEGLQFSTWVGTSSIVCRDIHIVDRMEKDVSLIFDLKCMNSFSKVSTLSTLSNEVTIRISSQLPTVFEYKIAKMGYIRYYMMAMGKKERQSEGDEMQRIAKEDKMQN